MASNQDINEVYPKKIWEQIGAGNFGTVYIGKPKMVAMNEMNTGGGRVAIKKYDKKNQTAQLDFNAERNAFELICPHPHLPLLHGSYDNIDAYYIVFEFFPCGSLDKIFTVLGKYDESVVRKIVEDCASALNHCLKNGIVHRDIKLDNVLVRKWKPIDVAITDFNFAKNLGLRGKKTIMTTCLGTLGYQAPEVYEASSKSNEKPKPFNFKCDIWSLGALTYTLLSGNLQPFRLTYDDLQVLAAKNHLNDIAAEALIKERVSAGKFMFSPTDRWANVSKPGKNITKAMLLRDPKKRPDYEQILTDAWFEEEFDLDAPMLYNETIAQANDFDRQRMEDELARNDVI